MQPHDSQNPHGPVVAGDLSIQVDTDMCTGAATCMAIAPKAFHVSPGEKAIILDSVSEAERTTIIEAARSCPTNAIIIKDSSGKQIYPA